MGFPVYFGGILWRVLEVQNGKALIISESVLTKSTYHLVSEQVTWEECDLRKYLNGEFYENTFSEQEKIRIIETKVISNDNQEYGTAGGNDTTDKVFLLSIEEANCYFDDDSAKVVLESTRERFWLRSPGFSGDSAATVDTRYTDAVSVRGDLVRNDIGVRPAMWITL